MPNATVSKEDVNVSGDSIMGLLMLAAAKGSQINISTTGPEANELSQALTNLILNRFDEDF